MTDRARRAVHRGHEVNVMTRGSILVRILWFIGVLAVACTLPARAEPPAAAATVRIQAFSIEAGWHEGHLAKGPDGCTVIAFVEPSAEGAASLPLAHVDWLEVRRNGGWSTVLVERLLAKDPAACRLTLAEAQAASGF
jgi:hypothetical protein